MIEAITKDAFVEWLNNLPDGGIVQVPLTSAVFDQNWRNHETRRYAEPGWLDRCESMLSRWDDSRNSPLNWNKQAQQIDDGGHRLYCLKKRGALSVPVMASDTAWVDKNKRLPFQVFQAMISKMGTDNEKDASWVEGCSEKKWFLFGPQIEWHNKAVLDVGCQCGFSVYQAAACGANSAIGWDVRPSVLEVAKALDNIFLDSPVAFFQRDFTRDAGMILDSTVAHFDVVICLGCAHYFPADSYIDAIFNLFKVAKSWLVLELRHNPRRTDGCHARGGQVLTTDGFLLAVAEQYGFDVWDMWDKPGNCNDRRKLWIFKRRGDHANA